jgi:hypothetical protein
MSEAVVAWITSPLGPTKTGEAKMESRVAGDGSRLSVRQQLG